MYSNFFEHLFLPIVERKYGMSIRRQLRELEETQWWSPHQLQELQNERLRLLINHAYEKVPFYRRIFQKRNLTPRNIQSVNDLPKLPILSKKEIRNNFDSMLSSDFSQRKQKLNRTGGSTGEPLKFYIDWEAWSMSWACIYLGWRFAGYKFGDKMASLGGSSLFPDETITVQTRIRRFLERNLALSATHMSDDIMKEYFKFIEKHQPKFLRGYPSALYVFANYLKENRLTPLKPKAVFTTAEVLYPNYRELIEEVFQCRVFDGYGCGDGGGSALECTEHKGHHIPIQRVVMEFVNDAGQTIAAGQAGNIVLTDLFNYSMPFIRYQVGDAGIPSDQTCSCGRGLPLLKELSGRTTDIIKLRNGMTLSGPAFTLIFKEFPIQQYQIVQIDLDNIIIRIVKGKTYTEKDSKRLLNTIERHVGRKGSVQLEFVENITATKAGKRLFFISNISQL